MQPILQTQPILIGVSVRNQELDRMVTVFSTQST